MKKKVRKELDEATRASVKKEMAKPRMAKSARERDWLLLCFQFCRTQGRARGWSSFVPPSPRTASCGHSAGYLRLLAGSLPRRRQLCDSTCSTGSEFRPQSECPFSAAQRIVLRSNIS